MSPSASFSDSNDARARPAARNPSERPTEDPARSLRVLEWATRAQRRVLRTLFAIFGPDFAYAFSALLARCLYRLLPPLREWSESNCRRALGDRLSRRQIERLAHAAFLHRTWNLTDLLLAGRFLRAGDLERRGGRIPAQPLRRLRDAIARRQPFLLMTAYYGPFDLLPLLLGWNGVPIPVIYRAHASPAFDRFRRQLRGASGCELIPIEQALDRLPRILEQGGGAALLVDHHVARGGLRVDFLGAPTTISRAPGILAARYSADVVVAGVRRIGRRFRFQIEVSDVIDHTEFAEHDEPVEYVLRRCVRGLERLVLADPAQYLWVHDRWGEARKSVARHRG